jgi:deoxyribodipyrimidine photolyase
MENNKKTLVWLTHSFRLDSRLMSTLTGPCVFIYYSPYYFAGDREVNILKSCSKQNLDAFYESLDSIKTQLADKGHTLLISKTKDPVSHINNIIDTYNFTDVVIDTPQFSMWKSINIDLISTDVTFIDSDLIDDKCVNLTAKARWMSHIKQIDSFVPHAWNESIVQYSISESTSTYPKYKSNNLINAKSVLTRAKAISRTYYETRDAHFGQTRLSTAFQNGTIDPRNTFYTIAKQFQAKGADFTKNEGAHAAMLRQFGFREMATIKGRRSNLTMEDSHEVWAKYALTEKSYENLIAKTNPTSTLTFDNIKAANTGDELIDQILRESYITGVMPNRARMFFGGWMFYNASTGMEALKMIIATFDLLLIDGQCPTNYSQSVSCMNLQYGRVMLLNRIKVKSLLKYND